MSRFADAFFGTAIAVLFVGLAAWFIPPSFWLEVKSVQVLDSREGTAPKMIIDRIIHRPVVADWTVSVLKVEPEGASAFCSVRGHNDYDTDAVIPADVDLDWWTWPEKCNLPAGQYVVRTYWEMRHFGFLTKDIRITSNPFNIYPARDSNDAE